MITPLLRIKLILECTICHARYVHTKRGLSFFDCFSSHVSKYSIGFASEISLLNQCLLKDLHPFALGTLGNAFLLFLPCFLFIPCTKFK